MKILRFESEDSAKQRTIYEAIKRGCNMVNTRYWWGLNSDSDGYYLEINDEDGLTQEELERCVEKLE